MGSRSNQNFVNDAIISWINDNQHAIDSVNLKVREACDSSLSLETNGRLLQIVLPSSFQRGFNEEINSDEVFLVTSLDSNADEAFANTLNGLNEKLERIRVKPAALRQALDQVFLALQKLEANRGQNVQNGTLDYGRRNGAHERFNKARDIYETDDQSDDENRAELIEGEDSDVDIYGGDEDHFGYDLAAGESSCRGSDVGYRLRGFLYTLASDARLKCEAFQKITDWSISKGHNTSVSDDILKWCSVNPEPEFLSIHFHIELAGIVHDDNAVAALGFSLNSPVRLLLEFSKSSWSLAEYSHSRTHLKPETIVVRQEMTTSQANTAKKGYEDDLVKETLKLRNIDHTHLYGIEVLLPELVRRFFDFLDKRASGEHIVHDQILCNPHLLSELEQYASYDNPFVGLLCFIGSRFRALPNWCVVCWNFLPYTVWRLRTCDSDFCLFRFEELGLGAPVLQEVQTCPELIDFELSLALVAACSRRDVFEPFPAFLLQREELRGRSGWFSKLESVQEQSVRTSNQTVTQRSGNTAGGMHSYVVQNANKNLKLLQGMLRSFPSIVKMQQCSDEVSLKKVLTKFWNMKLQQDGPGKREEESQINLEWSKKLWLPYDVMRFVLSTNRLSLHLLQGDEKLDFKNTIYQFAVLHDTPEREAHFEHRSMVQGGSFFAYHGSAADNWFSILRNGLRCLSNTNYMSTGAAYGAGIYITSSVSTSLIYCHSTGPGWDHGLLQDGFSVMSICEVVNGSIRSTAMPSEIMVVLPEHEKDVAIRYILVFKGQLLDGNHTISGTVLAGKTDLRLHFSNLRSSFLAKQQEEQYIRKEARCKALASLQKKRELETEAPLPASRVEVKRGRTMKSNQSAPSAGSVQAILKEYRNIVKQINAVADTNAIKEGGALPILAGIKVCIPDESNVCRWRASLSQELFKNWPLYKDLVECSRQWKVPKVTIELEFIFPDTYPFAPPFVRVVSPKFMFHTGHVTVGGSICMELLTESGWSPACSFESVIVQIVNAMIEGDGRLDRGAWGSCAEYSELEAREAFDRVARAHGWKSDRH